MAHTHMEQNTHTVTDTHTHTHTHTESAYGVQLLLAANEKCQPTHGDGDIAAPILSGYYVRTTLIQLTHST